MFSIIGSDSSVVLWPVSARWQGVEAVTFTQFPRLGLQHRVCTV